MPISRRQLLGQFGAAAMAAPRRKPNVILIYADDLWWSEAARLSNLAPGKWVILVGENAPKIGLPIVPTAFKWADLAQFTDIEDLASEVTRLLPHPVRFALTMPGPHAALV